MEFWKDIKGYEGVYQVSNYGRVKRLAGVMIYNTGRKVYYKEVIFKPSIKKNGYLQVHLSSHMQKKNFYVHGLVAEAFLTKPNEKVQVNHKDENKTNNFVYVNEDGTVDEEKSNLEWVSASVNANWGTRNQRMINHLENKRVKKPVLQYDLNGNFIKRWDSICQIYKELGYYKANIIKCCKEKYIQSYGYKWKYEETDNYNNSNPVDR